jgi:hypothetical protein
MHLHGDLATGWLTEDRPLPEIREACGIEKKGRGSCHAPEHFSVKGIRFTVKKCGAFNES